MNIFITGISKGLGLTICKLCLLNNLNVYGISRTITNELQFLIDNNKNIHWRSIDLSNIETHNEIFKDFLKDVKIDGFVNNAAIVYDDLSTNLNINKLNNMFQVNVYSPMMLTKYIIRNMLYFKTQGSIIHISSISAHTGYKGLSMYASSKSAIEGYSKGISREWGIKGIRSNVVVPGFMETEMSAKLTDEQKSSIYKRTSMKQTTDINSVAETVLFLLGNKSISITGQNIFVDSGTI